jgi:sialic acid synthase SpsE
MSINLDQTAWKELFAYAKELGVFIIAMCNDLPSLRFASKLNPEAYDIHASCLSDEDFVKEVAKQKKPVFLGIGASSLGEIERAISWIRETGNGEIALMYGFQSYPTKLEDMHLKYIQSLKQMFLLPVGFADHTDGGSEFALITPLIASAFGANIIEKHLTHDRSARGEDFESALNPSDLTRLVQLLREVEKADGSPAVRPFSEAELKYRQVSKKRAVARVDIKKNEKLTKDKVAFKRADAGVYPEETKFLIGRRAQCSIMKDESLTWEKML